MITPIKTMTISQIIARQDDLLVSADDVKAIAKNERAKVFEECMDIVPFRIDDGAYSDGFNDCSKKVLDRLKELKEQI